LAGGVIAPEDLIGSADRFSGQHLPSGAGVSRAGGRAHEGDRCDRGANAGVGLAGAVMAAKAYSTTSLNRYFEIMELDTQYWASHSSALNFRRFLNKTTPLDRYIIILNKLEESERKEALYKSKITSMFHASFA
jgi:hypothetical protein